MDIKTVTIIGANGTMGCNISAIFAAFGNAKVYMVSRSIEKSEKAVERAVKSVKADSIRSKLIPADFSMLEMCVRESDLVFESASEDFAVKVDIAKEISKYINDNTICCTGTSGLSVTKLAEVFPEQYRKNYFGIHMYNPPYNMTLCELIPTEYSDSGLVKELIGYLSGSLYRTTVVVKDYPAFIGNRIGFQFINEALQYADKYKYNGGIDYIDSILGQFTGRSMAPLVTSDFVGLDVHKAIVDNLYQNTNDFAHETFVMPDFSINLIREGKLGRKAGGGLYKVDTRDDGTKRYLVYDISTNEYREKVKYNFPFVESMVASLKIGDYASAFHTLINNHSIEAEMCLEFLMKYIVYSLEVASVVGYDIHSADDVMATGFSWCPPLALIQALFGKDYFYQLAKERLDRNILDQIDLEKLLSYVTNSNYDYRRFIRAKR